jgi:tetratricopeptide (TPR) repeat protein
MEHFASRRSDFEQCAAVRWRAVAQVLGADRFVGRSGELREVLAACRASAEGRGTLTVISGEEGIGKTRLCTEVRNRAQRDGINVIVARCCGDGGATALWPWQPILDELCGASAFQLLAGEADLSTAERDRFARFAAVTDEIAAACRRTPTCLIIDDIHAADGGTLLLTRFVARSLHRINLALVLTRRATEPPSDSIEARLIDEIEREASLITLHRFGSAETAEFLAAHGVQGLDEDMLAVILRVTEGHPLHLRRIAAMGSTAPTAGMAPGLRAAIDHAVAKLAPETQRILRTAAVLGNTTTVIEAAAVVPADVAAVLDAVRNAEAAGLVVAETTSRFSFTHEVVRATLVDGLRPAERLDAHARVVDAILTDDRVTSADPLIRRAHHALAAAPRSVADAHRAVDACRTAARSLIHSFAYEQADNLLSAAIELHELPSLDAPPGQLLVEWAQAALLCGRLAESRDRFARALAVAEHQDDPVLLAEALMGLAGYWLTEPREPVERARVRAQQAVALAALPEHERPLRCRLAARVAAETFYNGGPIEPMYEALDAARQCGDSTALAEALSLCHHALMRPEYSRARLSLADELVRVGAEAGHGVLGLMGLCWRTLDLFDLGDPRATRALEDLRQRADTLACQAILYVVGLMDVMLRIRSGRLAEAEALAHSCYEVGTEVGDVDAHAYVAAQLGIIHWLQGRSAESMELLDSIASSPQLYDADFVYRAAAATFADVAGNRDRARQVLDDLTANGLAALPRSSTWLVGMMVVTELAAALGDEDAARDAYDLLHPFAELPIVPSLGVVCFGSTHRPLGIAARVFGDHERAVDHFEQAVAANQRLGNLPLTALVQAELASTLLAGEDRRRHADAVRLLAEAIDKAEAAEMPARAAGWRAQLSELQAQGLVADADADSAAPPPGGGVRAGGPHGAPLDRPRRYGMVGREGSGWHIAVDERHAHVGNLVGMDYLVQLLAHPGQAIPALALVGHSRAPETMSRQELLDVGARSAYLARARDLAEELREAEAHANIGRAERLRAELDVLVEQIQSATGLGGRPRSFAGPDERARTAVRKAIMRAIDAIEAADRSIGSLLRSTITTGRTCIYTPSPEQPITWSTTPR